MANKCILIIGGARSGKSDYAQKLALSHGGDVLFVATAQALDDEMRVRIEAHRKARPAEWRTLELTKGLGRRIPEHADDAGVVIIDCLTLLVSNLVGRGGSGEEAGRRVQREISSLLRCLDGTNATFVIVSNEVGLGLVPDNPLGRLYRDLLGEANQAVARRADEVYFMVASMPLKLKGKTDE
ncbi:MAG: bifunctional adenosylcobinamide kinase/adenosylcobinamide-phosphate guanylyltransferase [Chloroflexota bacterium]